MDYRIIRRISINFIISGGTSPQPNITCTQLFEFVKNSAIQILEIFYNDDIKSVDEMHKLSTLYPTNALLYVAYEIKSSSGYLHDHIGKSKDAMEGGMVGQLIIKETCSKMVKSGLYRNVFAVLAENKHVKLINSYSGV